MGARKIIVANVGPIGCIPYERDTNPNSGGDCVAFPNQIAQLYNSQLKSLTAELNAKLKGSTFVYADVYHIVDDVLQNYESYGAYFQYVLPQFSKTKVQTLYHFSNIYGYLTCNTKYLLYYVSNTTNVILHVQFINTITSKSTCKSIYSFGTCKSV